MAHVARGFTLAAVCAMLAGCGGGGSGSTGGGVTGTPPVTAVTVSASSLSFSASAGLSAANQTVTLTNTGTTSVTITSVAVSGTNAGLFTETTTCGASLATGTSCTATVAFAPTASGTFTGTLTFSNTAANQMVSLTGTGLVQAPPSETTDCSVGVSGCGGALFSPTLPVSSPTYGELATDTVAAGLFHGYADPSMRKDPNAPTIYIAYSWAKTLADGTHVVDLHLASSSDGGTTWTYVGPLYQSVQSTQTQSAAYSSVNDSSTETVDLLPIPLTGASAGQTLWVQAHQSYLVAPQGGIYDQLNATNLVSVTAVQVATPASAGAGTVLLGLSSAPEGRLGAAGTDPSRSTTQTLTTLSPATSKCANWGQPTLWYQGGTLYLALECTEFSGSGQLDGNELAHFVYATTPTGANASLWTWSYVGEFATAAQAAKLGALEGTSYSFFTEPEFVSTKTGQLAVIMTPGVFNLSPTATQPVIQYGCRVVPVTLTPSSVTLDVDATTGSPVVLAKVTENDLYTGVNEGPAACLYEPAATSGIVMGRKYENDPNSPFGFYLYPLATGIFP
jgi:hypothetical protein